MVFHPPEGAADGCEAVDGRMGGDAQGVVERDDVVRRHVAQAEGGHGEADARLAQPIAAEGGQAHHPEGDAGYLVTQPGRYLVGPFFDENGRLIAEVEHFVVGRDGGCRQDLVYLIDGVLHVAVGLGARAVAEMDVAAVAHHVEEVAVGHAEPRSPDGRGAQQGPVAGGRTVPDELFGDDFALAVAGGGGVVVLVAGDVARVADEHGRGDEQFPESAQPFGGAEHVVHAVGVGAVVADSRSVEVGACGQMNDVVGRKGLERGVEGVVVEYVAGLPATVGLRLLGGADVEVEHCPTFLPVVVHHVGADESRAAGDDDPFCIIWS